MSEKLNALLKEAARLTNQTHPDPVDIPGGPGDGVFLDLPATYYAPPPTFEGDTLDELLNVCFMVVDYFGGRYSVNGIEPDVIKLADRVHAHFPKTGSARSIRLELNQQNVGRHSTFRHIFATYEEIDREWKLVDYRFGDKTEVDRSAHWWAQVVAQKVLLYFVEMHRVDFAKQSLGENLTRAMNIMPKKFHEELEQMLRKGGDPRSQVIAPFVSKHGDKILELEMSYDNFVEWLKFAKDATDVTEAELQDWYSDYQRAGVTYKQEVKTWIDLLRTYIS